MTKLLVIAELGRNRVDQTTQMVKNSGSEISSKALDAILRKG